jgi:hypothetical protein
MGRSTPRGEAIFAVVATAAALIVAGLVCARLLGLL